MNLSQLCCYSSLGETKGKNEIEEKLGNINN